LQIQCKRPMKKPVKTTCQPNRKIVERPRQTG